MSDDNALAARTARLRALLQSCPELTDAELAKLTGKSAKTIEMWRRGRPGAIPELSLRYLEREFSPSARA